MSTQSPTHYRDFLRAKSQVGGEHGFKPLWMPESLFGFQAHLTEWALRRGRAGIFADCGLGKTPMQLVWAENVVRHTNGRVLVLTPLAVGAQTVREADKFGVGPVCRLESDARQRCRVHVVNYERLHQVDPNDYTGAVLDESSILKNFNGPTRKRLTRFLSKMPYRLLCTATAAPNDYVELGTSAEALAELSHSDMLRRFFAQVDDKGQKRERRKQREAEALVGTGGNYFKKLSFRVSQTIGQWRLRHHAVTPFWRWVASWARACRRPSDLGFPDDGFALPPLTETEHVVEPAEPPPGLLFSAPAVGLYAERQEGKRTLAERCGLAARLVAHDRPAVVWCDTNAEGDELVRVIPGAEQVAGRTPEERRVELYAAFAAGELRVIVVKRRIGAWGLNWQHCNHVVAFATHSYEQHYQAVRRCWRFGQTRPVTVDVIATDGQERVLENLREKGRKAAAMFDVLVAEMNRAVRLERADAYTNAPEVPRWLA